MITDATKAFRTAIQLWKTDDKLDSYAAAVIVVAVGSVIYFQLRGVSRR